MPNADRPPVMGPPSARFTALALLAGAAWGVLGVALTSTMLGSAVWGGAIASPAIGLAAAMLCRGFRQRTPGIRITLALISLYVASGLFALAAGLMDAAHPVPDRNGGAVVIQTVVGVWWGITFTGYLPLLWPIAYLTHSLLGRVDVGGRGPAEPA